MDKQNQEFRETTFVMVDDNVDEIFLTRRFVRQEGFLNRFYSEKDPEALFNTLDDLVKYGHDKDSFLLLLDINMPRINGLDLLLAIKQHPTYSDVPVIMLTASDDEHDMFQAFELGSEGFLVKPFTGEKLFTVLESSKRIKKKLLQ